MGGQQKTCWVRGPIAFITLQECIKIPAGLGEGGLNNRIPDIACTMHALVVLLGEGI